MVRETRQSNQALAPPAAAERRRNLHHCFGSGTSQPEQTHLIGLVCWMLCFYTALAETGVAHL